MQFFSVSLEFAFMLSDRLKLYLPAIFLSLLTFALAYQFVDPAPPSSITFSAGQKGGAYYAYAEQYRAFLAQRGIEVEILESAGSVENLKRLASGRADIGFVQSGVTGHADSSLVSLGSMYYEPLWIFLQQGIHAKQINELKGLRIAIGPAGSGTQALARALLASNGIDANAATLLETDTSAAAKALREGSIDAMFIVSDAGSKTIRSLTDNPQLQLMDIPRYAAYSRQFESISPRSLPAGTLDLARNVPAHEIHMLANTATLVTDAALHPALQDLIMQAATAIHSGHSIFARAGSFPTADFTGMPISEQAQHYYRYGPPLLQRYLPFWAATLIDRLKVMLLPLIALLLPLFKIMPPLYRWRIRSRIYRWYRELNRIDSALAQGFDTTLLDDLDRITAEIRKGHVPLSYAEELYDLRLHLALVREQLETSRERE